jgi:hypothetical protein
MLALAIKAHLHYFKAVSHKRIETIIYLFTDEEIEERSNILIVVAVVLFDFALVLTAAVHFIYLHHKVK